MSTAHTYSPAGNYTVSLTVTNGDGNSTATTQVVSPHAAAAAPIAFVGSASVNGNKSALSVTVPSCGRGRKRDAAVRQRGEQGGDHCTGRLDAGRTDAEFADVDHDGGVRARSPQPSDAGSTVTVGFVGTPHETVQLVAYSGTNTSNPVLTSANNSTASGSSLTSPTVSIGAGGAWVVSYYSAKSSVVTAWTVPASQTTRDADNGTGSGRINSVVADSGAAVPAGSAGGITATTDQPVGGADSWTIVLTP